MIWLPGKSPSTAAAKRPLSLSLLWTSWECPLSSQMLVFSATSLQLSLISTRNPRALFFTDDLYVGWMPGGKMEIVSLDPALGGIYYIFDIPRREGGALNVERSNRCMNCHGAADSGWVPGLVISSVIPGPNSGSLIAIVRKCWAMPCRWANAWAAGW